MTPPASTTIARKLARVATIAENSAHKKKKKKKPTPKASIAKVNKVVVHEKAKVHPPYYEERTSSNQYAIAKFIETKQNDLLLNLKRLLLVQLKKLLGTVPTSEKPKVPVKIKKEEVSKKVTVVTIGKPKKAAGTKKEAAKTKKVGKEKGKKRNVVATAPNVKKTLVKKPKSVKSPAKKLKK
ncbi:hypothetical protein M9H77_35376 [Catharanthus roseus]|uniref:Uncharacterized protein n=1 Tax=Catharanthus roseus TaxID=4058 RepID=A0ACB9ZNV5_CATRO|nr:hypothetical protein M9H77_35376 [Catharanthus roseus]